MLYLLTAVAVLLTLMYVTSRFIIGRGYSDLEHSQAVGEVNRVLALMDDWESTLDIMAVEYAQWDETYEFISGTRSNYISTNFHEDESFRPVGMDLMLFLNRSGEVIHIQAFGSEQTRLMEHAEELTRLLSEHTDLWALSSPTDSLSGVTFLGESPFLLASRAITPTNPAAINGTLVVARNLDTAALRRLSASSDATISFRTADDPAESPGPTVLGAVSVEEKSDDVIVTHTMIPDLVSQGPIEITVELFRNIHQQANTTIRYFSGWIIVISLLLIALTILILERTVLSGLANLSNQVTAIDLNNKPMRMIDVKGKDELARLSDKINALLLRVNYASERRLLQTMRRDQTRIANDLHDGVGQLLTGTSYMVASTKKRLENTSKAASELDDIEAKLGEAISDLRLISKGLSPVPLGQDGLESALTNLLRNAETAFNIRCSLQFADTLDCDNHETASHIYHIVEEAITNAVKHGNAENVVVTFRQSGDKSILTVDDDGSGIETDGMSDGGIGLHTMQLRAHEIGGQVAVVKRPGGGTRVLLERPNEPVLRDSNETHVRASA